MNPSCALQQQLEPLLTSGLGGSHGGRGAWLNFQNTGTYVLLVSAPSLISGEMRTRERGIAAEGGKGQVNQGRHHFLQPFELLIVCCILTFVSHLLQGRASGSCFF